MALTTVQEEKFAKIKPMLSENQAVVEASRCLFCHDAPCINACPTSIDIPMFIRQIMTKNTKGSAETILKQNILGKSCGQVCPTEVLCEGACVYHHLNKKPIEIGRLQSFAVDYAIKNNITLFSKGKQTGKKVAVIGGGPSGLACAHSLVRLGHQVVVFESSQKAGGLNTYGVAPYKFTNKDSEEEVKYISQIGFEIKTNTRVVSQEKSDIKKGEISLDEIEKKYDAIYIAAGLGKSKTVGVPGENLNGVIGASEFIYGLREKEQKIKVGNKVIVIGGGNTAIDAAIESSKLGADVTVIYRRAEADQNAYFFEVDLAKENNVLFLYLVSPLEIIGKTHVEGIRCIKNKEEGKANKKSNIKPVLGTEFVIPCDMVVIACGQEKFIDFYKSIPKLQLKNGTVIVNNNFQTTNPKYFAGGDCINGGKEVVHAVSHGRDAALGIHKYLIGSENG